MFDWSAELEVAKLRVAELEEKVSGLRDQLQQTAATPIQSVFDQGRRILSVRLTSLELAKAHERFIEHKIASGVKAAGPVPYLELSQVCFNAAKSMPQGEAAEAMRTHATAFYRKAMDRKKAPLD
jgi:hypothetical protein